MSDLGPKESSSNEKLDEIENPKDEKSNEIENKEEERIEEKKEEENEKEEEKEKEDKNDDDKSEEEKEKSETSKDSDNDSESKDSKDDKDKDEDEKEENEEDDSEDDLDVDDDDDDANSDFSSTDKQKDPQHGYLNSKTENKNFFNNVNKNDYVYGIKQNKFYKIVGSKNIANDKRAEIYKFELKEVKSIQKINIKLNKNIQYMASIYGKATEIEENKKKEEKDDKDNLEKKEEIEENKEENKKDEIKEENKKEEIKDEIKEEKKEETKEEKKEEKEDEKKEEKKEESENKDEQKETKEKTKDKKEKEKNKDKGKKKTKKKINLNLFAVIKDLTEYTFFQKIRVIYLNSLNNPIVYYLRINMNTTIKEIINQFSSLYKYKKDRYSDKLPLNIFINGKKHSISNRTSSKYFIPTKFDYKNDYVLILEKQIFKLKEVDLGSRSNYINFKGVDVPHLVYNSVFNFEIDCLSVSKGLNFLDCKIYELKKDINLRQYTDNEHTIKQKLKEFLSLNWKDKTNFVTSFKSVKAIKSKENSYSAVLYELNRKFILLQGKMYIFVIKSNNKKLDAFYGRHISKDGVFIVSKNDKSLLSGFRGKSISDFIAYS